LMRHKTAFAVVSFLLVFSCLDAKSVKQFEKEITVRNKDLKDLQKSMNEKQAEKERALLEEKVIKRELNAIDQDLSKLQKKSEVLRRDIKQAEKRLVDSERDLRSANYEKNQWTAAMCSETALWFKAHHATDPLFCNPYEEKLRISALQKKRVYLTSAQERELNSRLALAKWQAAKQKLLDLKTKQEQNITQQEEAKGKKQELLKTATGKRVVAESELKKLSETAKALENLITGLEKDKEKTRLDETTSKKKPEKRKELEWPVEGKIVGTFGKSKHPEYDTVVINNGIRIQGAQGAAVRPAEKGEVLYTGEFRSYGQMVIIDHGGTLYSIYGQLGEISVEEGQKVKATDTVGKLSSKKEPLLYFEVRYNGKAEDPLLWLKGK
jgi:murein hydrolase activator